MNTFALFFRHKRLAIFCGTSLAILIVVAIWRVDRAEEQAQGCVGNLMSLDGAIQAWQEEKDLPFGTPINTNEIAAYIKGGIDSMKCHSGGKYIISKLGVPVECSVHGMLYVHSYCNFYPQEIRNSLRLPKFKNESETRWP